MADLLVQNAIEKVGESISNLKSPAAISYSSIFGVSLKNKLCAVMKASETCGPFTPASGGASLYLCDLTDVNKISYCQCAFSGSGTSCTQPYIAANIWNNTSVFGNVVTVNQACIIGCLNAGDAILKAVHDTCTAKIEDDMYYAWMSLQTELTNASCTDILSNWYGIGGAGAETQGKRLSETNYLKVCGTNWVCGEGRCCQWTVPAGVTKAKFQAWGAGRGSNPGCCCGGSPFAPTGAYAELYMDVTPGDQYTVCAGCSCQRFCCSNECPGHGCMSYVTGPNISCFKADGSFCNCDLMYGMNCARCCVQGGPGSICCRYQSMYCTSSGICWCTGEYFCFTSSCSTCGVVAVVPVMNWGHGLTNRGCSCASSGQLAGGVQRTHLPIWGGGCLDTNNYGWHTRPPIINSDTGSHFGCTLGCFCASFTSNGCCGGCNGSSWTWHPGHGGAYTPVSYTHLTLPTSDLV